MQTVKVIYTKTLMSPISWLIRWTLPRTRFALALSSHALIEYNGLLYEADFWNGVIAREPEIALKGSTIVRVVEYQVPNAEAGAAFGMEQVRLKRKYDRRGAIGLGLALDRDWSDPSDWFCYELVAAWLKAAGRDEFKHLHHVTETALLALRPEYTPVKTTVEKETA